MKKCRKCLCSDKERQFVKNERICVPCDNAEQRSRRKTKPHEQLLARYGITYDGYLGLLQKQGGVCAGCGGPPSGVGKKTGRFHVDHDHATGKVRGLLCQHCNLAVGHARDQASILRRLADYVEKS